MKFFFFFISRNIGIEQNKPTDPELKQWSNIRAAVRGEVGVHQQKNRAHLGSLFDIEHETTPHFVDEPQQRAFPKIRCDVTDRKASPDAPDFFGGFFLVESTRTQPEATDRHRQSPLLAHSNTPKSRRFPAGGAVHRPFSSGSVNRGFLSPSRGQPRLGLVVGFGGGA